MNTIPTLPQAILQKKSPEKERTEELEVFVNFVEESREMIQDILFFLRPNLEEEITKHKQKYEDDLKLYTKLNLGIDITDETIQIFDIATIQKLCYEGFNNIKPTNFINVRKEVEDRVTKLSAIYTFFKAKTIIDDNILSDASFELFNCFAPLMEISSVIYERNNKKLPVTFDYYGKKIETYEALFSNILIAKNQIYSKFFEKYRKELYRAKFENDLTVKTRIVNDNITLVAISTTILIDIFSDIKLSESEQKLFDSFLKSEVTTDGYHEIILIKDMSDSRFNSNLIILLGQLNKNIWVEEKVKAEIKRISTGSYKDRKVLTKIKLELFQYYGGAFDQMKISNKNLEYCVENFESDNVHTQIEISFEPYQYQPTHISDHNVAYIDNVQEKLEATSIAAFLPLDELREYEENVPSHIKTKVQSILEFILNENLAEGNNLGKVSYAMKYDSQLPMIPNQYCTMRFGSKLYPNTLKLNVNLGDRLIIYLDQDQLKVKFMNAQFYHNTRE
jgi:hypothetical protein